MSFNMSLRSYYLIFMGGDFWEKNLVRTRLRNKINRTGHNKKKKPGFGLLKQRKRKKGRMIERAREIEKNGN